MGTDYGQFLISLKATVENGARSFGKQPTEICDDLIDAIVAGD